MAYDEKLDARIAPLAASMGFGTKKKMFGGTCYLLQGNMVCGVHKGYLILRLGETKGTEYLARPHVRVFDITGKPMKGWVMVEKEAFPNDTALKELLTDAGNFAASLPPK